MKKTITILMVLTLIISCSKGSEQIQLVKASLKSKGVTDKELESYQFSVSQVLGQDAYDNVYNVYWLRNSKYPLAETLSIMDTLQKGRKKIIDKEYTSVIAFRLNGKDTISLSKYYITDKNQIYNLERIR